MNSTSPLFVNDNICPGAAAAAGKQGCVGPFSSFANGFLDIIFTALFGIVGMFDPSHCLERYTSLT